MGFEGKGWGTDRCAIGMDVRRIVSMRPYASVRVFNCTCIWLACGPWK